MARFVSGDEETYEALTEVWDNLGPPPEILYDKLPDER